MSDILEFRNVGFAHRERAIFEDLQFAVKQNEMTAVMGPNGAGKTTLLRLAAALLRPSEGEVLLHGRNLAGWKRKQLSQRIALVPQELEVPFAFTIEEIVAQGRVPHLGFFGGLSAEDIEAIESAMASADVRKMRRRVFSELSGGERQRVKIAIGLAQQPELMLLDEPTQHLDLGRQIELMALLEKLVKLGITVVAAVHDLGLVREHFSSGLLLTPNETAIAGDVAEVLRPDRLEHAFGVTHSDLNRYLNSGVAGTDALVEAAAGDGSEMQQRRKAPQEHEEVSVRNSPHRLRRKHRSTHREND